MSINAQNRSLPDWFARIRTRQTVLPRFQRAEAWDHNNVAQLFNTILQGLPVGALLVLEIGNEEPFISRPLVGAPERGERVTEHLLDGQQRLTALWRGLSNNYSERTYFLVMAPDPDTGMPHYVESIARWKKEDDEERRPFWANSPQETWERKRIPLEFCAPGEDAWKQFRSWATDAIDNRDDRDAVIDEMSTIRQTFAAFNLPYLSLPVTTSKSTALDVFLKMNTSAAPLSTYDIVVAQVEAGMGVSLHDLVANVKSHCPSIAHFYDPETLVLVASALLQERQPTNGTYLTKDFGTALYASRSSLLLGIKRTADFLEEERIFDARRLPSETVVPVLVALWAKAPKGLDAEGRARLLLRQYLWRAFFTNRYERATSSRALADYVELKKLVLGDANAKPPVFNDKQHPLPEPQEFMSAGWPKNKDRLARSILALALHKGGVDLADGSPVSRENLEKREYHHLFPDAYLRRQGVPDDRIYLALNCALVTWTTNRNISDKEPERYLAERLDGTGVDEAEVRSRLTSHLIPYDEMIAGDYEAFLKRRAELMHRSMADLCRMRVLA